MAEEEDQGVEDQGVEEVVGQAEGEEEEVAVDQVEEEVRHDPAVPAAQDLECLHTLPYSTVSFPRKSRFLKQ